MTGVSMNNEAIDVKEVLERVQEDRALLIELLDIFQDDYGHKRKELTQFLAIGQADGLRNVAHSLKGASSNISAKRIYDLFAQLEYTAEQGNLASVPQILKDIDARYKELEQCMARLKKELRNS